MVRVHVGEPFTWERTLATRWLTRDAGRESARRFSYIPSAAKVLAIHGNVAETLGFESRTRGSFRNVTFRHGAREQPAKTLALSG